MKLKTSQSSVIFLLLPSLAITAAVSDAPLSKDTVSTTDILASGRGLGTKDAPIDGKDGRPHAGPFVELNVPSSKADELPPLPSRPADPTIVDGKKIPDIHDGVMVDKAHAGPKKGTTGLEGGVTEKSREKILREQQGEIVENKPQTPKEAPPLEHSDHEKIAGGKGSKTTDKSSERTVEDVLGLEKPADLPEKTHDKSLPVPESVADIDHLAVSDTVKSGSPLLDNGENEGLIRPFHSFILSLTMIIFSEVGDKTFLVAALMAMKHDRLVVFSGALGALVTMTVLSAVLGHAVPTLISKRLTNFLAAGLFLVFGARLLREGLAMSPDEGVSAEMQEVEMELEEKENLARKKSDVSPYALEMGLGNRKSRSKSRFPAPARSPSSSPEGRSSSPRPSVLANFLSGLNNLLSFLLSPAWVQTFVMTFLGEWGDRSQIATIAMAAGQDYWWVTLGAIMGHACCTGVAVIGGRAIAGKVSLKVVTVGGAIAFLFFGVIYLFEAFYA